MNTNLGTWKKWKPEVDIFPNFCIKAIDNTTEGLFINLKNEIDNDNIVIMINVIWFSYRVIKIENCSKTIERLKEIEGPDFFDSWSLFEVEDSNYLKWFEKESLGIYEGVKHYVFMGYNLVFEVLMYEPGSLKIIKEDVS
ncbi:MAG TPA: hypothetical protein PLU71_01465 [Candidatus Dependentiae bacterium]|nr:hypothetical protein [Candidatus Dependentiae bacterium]HRQ62500.1 hypothetical protein [Candidatus Dependentiae bacterium]